MLHAPPFGPKMDEFNKQCDVPAFMGLYARTPCHGSVFMTELRLNSTAVHAILKGSDDEMSQNDEYTSRSV